MKDEQQEIIDEKNRRILQLLIERDQWRAKAEEKIALRREIDAVLEIETGDTNDEALAKGMKALRRVVRLDDPVVAGLVVACKRGFNIAELPCDEQFIQKALSAYEARVKEVSRE